MRRSSSLSGYIVCVLERGRLAGGYPRSLGMLLLRLRLRALLWMRLRGMLVVRRLRGGELLASAGAE
eukprot:4765897-Pyramimonas_sp.AAC.1